MKKILYLGWLGYHNFGDEWMWNMFDQLSKQYLSANKYQVIPSLPGVDIHDISAYDTIVLGGGSLLVPGYMDILYEAVQKRKKILIWGSGHDRLHRLLIHEDGSYTPEAENDNKLFHEQIRVVIENCDFCSIRGPWTYQYLEQCAVSMEAVSISGDPALLCLPTSIQPNISHIQKRWIGINWGTSHNRVYGKNEQYVEDCLAFAAQRWIRQGYDIYLYVVWDADQEVCQRLQQKIGFPERVVFDPHIHSLQLYLELMQRFVFTVNFKLHANILSAVANIPFICLGYRFKSYDFIHSINAPQFIIPTHAKQLEAELLAIATHAQQQRGDISSSMKRYREIAYQQLTLPFIEKLF